MVATGLPWQTAKATTDTETLPALADLHPLAMLAMVTTGLPWQTFTG